VNGPLLAAGALALLASAIHGVVGDRIVRRIDADSLPKNPFEDGFSTRFLIRVAWHFTTIAFVVTGVALVFSGVSPDEGPSMGLAYSAGSLLTSWAMLGLIAGFVRGGVRGWVTHPAPILLSISAALVWWGATWL
jgi:hypothetical protein